MRTFNANDSTYDLISDLVEGQYYANSNSYGYSAGYLSSVLEDVIRNLPDDKQKQWRERFDRERQLVWAKVS
jgi:hypothetical protein